MRLSNQWHGRFFRVLIYRNLLPVHMSLGKVWQLESALVGWDRIVSRYERLPLRLVSAAMSALPDGIIKPRS